MAAYRRVDDLTVTCRLTACTPGSAPGPTLGVEYGKHLPLPYRVLSLRNCFQSAICDLHSSQCGIFVFRLDPGREVTVFVV